MSPLSEDQFKKVIAEAVKNYSMAGGSMVQLRSKKKRAPYSLCISSIRNEGLFVPMYCVLWDDAKILYQGKLNNKNLLNIINRREICCFEFTSVDNLERNLPGYYICFGCRETCKVSNCKCRFEEYWQKMVKEHPVLTAPVIAVETQEAKKYMLDAWNDGWKKARRKKRESERKLENFRSRFAHLRESYSDSQTNSGGTEIAADSTNPATTKSIWDI